MKILSRLKSSYKVESDAYNDVRNCIEKTKNAIKNLLKLNTVLRTDSKVLVKISKLKNENAIDTQEWVKVFDSLKNDYKANILSMEELKDCQYLLESLKDSCVALCESRIQDLEKVSDEQAEILEEQFGEVPLVTYER